MSGPPADRDLVFNVVWTGSVFPYLQYFVASQMAHSEARFRFVVNGCPPDQMALIEGFAADHDDRVVDVLDVAPTTVAHGVALDRVRELRDDGEYFCLIDPDIKANGPFVQELVGPLGGDCAVVTSGKEIWSQDSLVPLDWKGVAGEHFMSRDGFVFGSPHLAVYRRDALEATSQRWGIGFQAAGPELSDEPKARLLAMGHEYLLYDTAKLINTFLQADGHALVHRELPQLVHIGGLSHYFEPDAWITGDDGERKPWWAQFEVVADRHLVTKYTAALLRHLCDGAPEPEMPTVTQPSMQQKLALVRHEVMDLIETHRS